MFLVLRHAHFLSKTVPPLRAASNKGTAGLWRKYGGLVARPWNRGTKVTFGPGATGTWFPKMDNANAHRVPAAACISALKERRN